MKKMRVVFPSIGSGGPARKAGLVALWVIGGGALVGLAFVGSFYLAMRVEMRGTEVTVPDLSGLTLDAAAGRVEPLELVLQVVEQRHDPRVPSDRVLDQVPPPGASVRRGRKVRLVLSLGDEVLSVPKLVGQAARAVEIELRRDGFAPGYEVRVPSDRIEAGRVLAQVPPAGTPAVPNSRVHRLISDGPPRAKWVMPDLAGRTQEQIERWAQRSGLRVAVRRIDRSGRAAGTVLGQFPLAGFPVHERDVVELTVAR